MLAAQHGSYSRGSVENMASDRSFDEERPTEIPLVSRPGVVRQLVVIDMLAPRLILDDGVTPRSDGSSM